MKKQWIELGIKVLERLKQDPEWLQGIGLTYDSNKKLKKFEIEILPTKELEGFEFK